ncbi:MAG: type I glyceraldehyde-3-phosphate dehydrogenase [Bacteroidota bacterium]
MIRVAINGFGRIGRTVSRILLAEPGTELVAINDLADADIMSHLFKYDSVHGKFNGTVSPGSDGASIDINGTKIPYSSIKNLSELPWKQLNVDVVIDCTGIHKDQESASQHITAGAKKVIISAPADDSDIKTIVIGVNDDILTDSDVILSNASCTTNSAAPMIQLIDDLCGIQSGYITTVHSYTGDQRLHDTPNKDYRRARAAAVSIVPTTTGAAKAMNKIFPNLNDRLGGCGIRVPVPDGSLTDLTCVVDRPITVDELNAAFKKASTGRYLNILEYTDEPIVSIDIVGNPHSCIFDSQLTSIIGNTIKVVGWYDNEMGYSHRLKDLVVKMFS